MKGVTKCNDLFTWVSYFHIIIGNHSCHLQIDFVRESLLFWVLSSQGEQQWSLFCWNVSCCQCRVYPRVPACRLAWVCVHGNQDTACCKWTIVWLIYSTFWVIENSAFYCPSCVLVCLSSIVQCIIVHFLWRSAMCTKPHQYPDSTDKLSYQIWGNHWAVFS